MARVHRSETERVDGAESGLDPDGPLWVVDAVARVLASGDIDDAATALGAATEVIHDRFRASLSAMLRFEEDGAHVIGILSGGRFEHDPQLRIDNDTLPAGSPLRTSRRPVVLEPDDFGPGFGLMLRELGPEQSLLAIPIIDNDEVNGTLALLAPGVELLGDGERVALQLCGELLWRHLRHYESRRELRERAEVAEILARIGGRLHEGGVGEARELLDEVFSVVGSYVGADVVGAYERSGAALGPLVEWRADGRPTDAQRIELTDELWALLEDRDPVVFDELHSSPLAPVLAPSTNSGVVVPDGSEGSLHGAFVVARASNRPLRATHLDLIVDAVQLLGQFRLRMGAELALVRRGVVDQVRTEIAEAFLSAVASELDAAMCMALERVGTVFGAQRVRWTEVSHDGRSGSVLLEWADPTMPEAPTRWANDASSAAFYSTAREPYVLDTTTIAEVSGLESSAPTLVVPVVVGDAVVAALTLTAERIEREMPTDERRALTDLAGLIHQARLRADQELEAEDRQRLDDLQLRLAGRFLDRGVTGAGEVLDWCLAEIAAVLDADLMAFAEYVGTSIGELHWWKRDTETVDGPQLLDDSREFYDGYFEQILEKGRPSVFRSRVMPEKMRLAVEDSAGSEVSMLVVPLRAPGIALLLGAAVLRDREWSASEITMAQQVISQIRQFIEVLASRTQLQYDATHDALTGLANRRKVMEEFSQLVGRDRCGGALMLDVDRFKVVNDSLGHSAGDAVLVAIADRIRLAVRDTDLVGRLGGDEFAVMMGGDVTDLELAAAAQRLITVIREPILVRGTTVIPTCSVGIATAGPDDDVEAVMRHADAALYDAKAKGRDRYEFFDETHRQSLRERLHLETGLRRGLIKGEFVPWFQPEYDLIEQEIVGVEALVRWNHPSDGVLDASRFIDTAEEIGLAPEMSRMVMRRSFETLEGWLAEGFRTRMRVNVAAAQLQSNELAEQVRDALERHRIPADLLCVEITERSLMLDPDSAVEVLGRVRDLGVEVAVDDFGTGFSSLARLKNLPVDTLKIDRMFVRGIVDSRTDREIVRTIIWLSRGLGLDVVAEGVEEPEQVEILLELGCRRAQGWLWSPAVPAEQVRDLASMSPSEAAMAARPPDSPTMSTRIRSSEIG